ncbi:MAG: hypothetical protein XE08_0139 [Parcubacteria bacterium 32_520]|nr:MAG: hypothetical protein XE08_0139 [Parcubacteria bacterium 32_520]
MDQNRNTESLEYRAIILKIGIGEYFKEQIYVGIPISTINYESSNPIQWEKDLENSNIFERNMGNFCYSINHCPLELYSQNIEGVVDCISETNSNCIKVSDTEIEYRTCIN